MLPITVDIQPRPRPETAFLASLCKRQLTISVLRFSLDAMSEQQPPPQAGPPYAPRIASVGGRATVGVDVPISAVFLVLFAIGAAGHMTIFQINRRRGHKFIMSALTFGFCMARIVTMIMRSKLQRQALF